MIIFYFDELFYIKVKENFLKKAIKALVMGLMCFAGNVFANSTNLNFILGSSFSQLSNKQYISPTSGLINSYNSKESVQFRPFYGFGVEYDFDHITTQPITFGLGLSFYYVDLGNISGIETPGVNILPPPPDTLTYKMQAKSSTILLEPKLIYTAFHLQPYIFGGVGYGWNSLSNFSEGTVPGSSATPSTSPYPNHTQTEFTYEAGLGLQYIFQECKNNRTIIFHIEYRYLNLGQSRLGTSAAQTTNDHITVNNSTNVIDFGITYRL